MSMEIRTTADIPVWMKDANGLGHNPNRKLTLASVQKDDSRWMVTLEMPFASLTRDEQVNGVAKVWVSRLDLERALEKLK